MLNNIPYIAYALAALAAIVIAFVVVGSSASKETNRINEDNIKALQTQNGLHKEQLTTLKLDNAELKKTVGVLSVKVDTLSTIPVQKIEQHMKDANKQMADTNKILRAVLPLLSQPSTTHTTTETLKTTGLS